MPSSRPHLGVTQALLALILLACLPVANLAGSRSVWFSEPADAAVQVISESAGDAEAPGSAVNSFFDWSEADEDPDGDGALAAAFIHLQNPWATDRRRASGRVDSRAGRPRAHPATGPPAA